jgi:hypothetical protein
MPVDLGKWVEGLKLPEAEKAAVVAAIGKGGDEALKYIEGNQLRQDEFSRKLNDLQADIQKKEDDLKRKVAVEDSYHNSLATWDTKRKTELAEAKTARETSERVLAAAREKVAKLATDFDIPADQVSGLFEGAPVVTRQDPPPNTHVDPKEFEGRFVSKETFQAEARAYAKFAALIPSLERQHFKLFGEAAESPNWEKLIEDTVAASGAKTLKQIYEDQYKVNEKREELRNAEVTAKVETARREGAEAERAKMLADNPTLAGQGVRSGEREGSPVLALAKTQAAKAAEGKAPVTAPVNPVAAAVAAFNSGKYKTGDKAA